MGCKDNIFPEYKARFSKGLRMAVQAYPMIRYVIIPSISCNRL